MNGIYAPLSRSGRNQVRKLFGLPPETAFDRWQRLASPRYEGWLATACKLFYVVTPLLVPVILYLRYAP